MKFILSSGAWWKVLDSGPGTFSSVGPWVSYRAALGSFSLPWSGGRLPASGAGLAWAAYPAVTRGSHWTDGTGEISFAGLHGDRASIWKRARKTVHLGQLLSRYPWEPIWTMDRLSLPSTGFGYFTVFTRRLESVVKLHTSSGFLQGLWAFSPTSGFLRLNLVL